MFAPSFPHGTAPTLTISFVGGIDRYACRQHVWNTFQKQELLYKEQKFCDVVLVAGNDGTRVPAHKVVLSASSAYFDAMFSCSMIEAKSQEVTIEQVSGLTLKSLVDFIYSGSIELCSETIESILRAGDFFQLEDVVAACCSYMLRNLNLSNCLRTALLAEQHNCREVHAKAFGLACSNFEEVCAGVTFLELDEEQLDKLLSSDELCVPSEEKVFLSLVAWVRHKPSREGSLLRLLPHIRFNLLKPDFIQANRNLVCQSLKCEQLIAEWLEWHKEPSAEHSKPSKPRRSNDKLALVSQFCQTGILKLQTYNRATNDWFHVIIPSLQNAFCHTWIYSNNKLIIAGGGTKDEATKRAECLDLQSMQWTRLPPMRVARHLCSLAELNGQLYVIGGAALAKWSLSKIGPSVEKFDFRKSQWQTVAPLPRRVGSNILVAALDGLIYAISVETCALECYDPFTNKWSQRAHKSENATQFGMAAVGRYLYTVGGYYNGQRSTTVERYDPTTDSWIVVSHLRTGRTDIKCIALRNSLIACGGHDGEKNANIVEEYNPETGEWKNLAQVPFFLNYYCIPVVLKDRAQT